MKRREFMRTAIPAGIVLPSLINGLTLKAFGASPIISALTAEAVETDRILVLIQLNGGNDGLNTVIPLDQYGNLFNARKNIIIPEKKILKLDGVDNTGLHPAMTGMQSLYNQGKVQIIQSVGYPQPNFSHFRSSDIWATGSDSSQTLSSGWMGRYLNEEYANYPVNYPNSNMPDPLAIQIGSFTSPALHGHSHNMGMVISDPNNFTNLLQGTQDPAPDTYAGKELTYIRQVTQQTQQYASVIKTAASKVTKQVEYPTGNLAYHLKIVSRLIAGGLKTRVYMVSMSGFDTHSLQVNASATETGAHATLLLKVSEAIRAFMADLKYLNVSDKVVGMTFSEFGRRIKSNSSGGTDHGASAPLFVFGDNVQKGILGTNPVISGTVTFDDNVPMQYDFRSVYSSVLKNWFNVSSTTLNNVMLKNYQNLPVITTTSPSAPPSLNELTQDISKKLISNYPNPFKEVTRVKYVTDGGHTLIQIFNQQGILIKNLIDEIAAPGTFEVDFKNEGYPAGIYYARFQNGAKQQVLTMLLVN